jgi:hypothetical protein
VSGPQDRNDDYNISGAQFTQPAEDFKLATPTQLTKFRFCDVPPAPGLYIDVNDQLHVAIAGNSATDPAIVNVRILGTNGKITPLKFVVNGGAGRTFNVNRFQLVEGYLQSVTIVSNGAESSGKLIYAVAALVRAPFGAKEQYHTLCAGYVYLELGMSWPNAPAQRMGEGAGAIRSTTGTVPGAGVDITETVPAGARWRLISIRATLTTAVAVANRLVSIVLDDGANIYADSPSNFTQAASIVNTYNAFDSCPYQNVPFNLRTNQPLPSNVLMMPGHRIRTVTTGIQAADQWTAPQYLVQEWFEDS